MALSLKQHRLIRGLRQRDIADHLKVHIQTYRKMESDPGIITIDQAKKISDILGVSYDALFFYSPTEL